MENQKTKRVAGDQVYLDWDAIARDMILNGKRYIIHVVDVEKHWRDAIHACYLANASLTVSQDGSWHLRPGEISPYYGPMPAAPARPLAATPQATGMPLWGRELSEEIRKLYRAVGRLEGRLNVGLGEPALGGEEPAMGIPPVGEEPAGGIGHVEAGGPGKEG